MVALKATSVAAERARQFIKRHNALMSGAERFWRAVDAVPAPVGPVLQSVKRRMIRETGWAELLLVVDSFEDLGLDYWLAGGWGVDALVQRQTRRHKDIDIVIDDFEGNEPKARQAFLALGFNHVTMDQGGVWMPWRSNFEDRAGHRIELLGIDWEHLNKVFTLAADPPTRARSSADLAAEILTVGMLNGRPIPCLTKSAQLLFHTGFPLENAGTTDVSLLQREFGTTT
jgi:lincosamide nucleotidyltransferase A/C/D/E